MTRDGRQVDEAIIPNTCMQSKSMAEMTSGPLTTGTRVLATSTETMGMKQVAPGMGEMMGAPTSPLIISTQIHPEGKLKLPHE